MSADFISDSITFRNSNNILESYVLSNKHRHSTKVWGEPNYINIYAVYFMYLNNTIVSYEKLSRSEKLALYDTDLERAISFIYQSSEVGCRVYINI
jgi:hypothetical protein